MDGLENEEAVAEGGAPDPESGGIAEDEKPSGIADGDGEDGLEKTGSEKGDENPDAVWELAAPEDFPLPPENLKSFSDEAKRLGLLREQAEGMLAWHKNFHNEAMAANEAAMKAQITAWQKEMEKDAEFGGARAKETLADSRKALKAFDTDGALRKMLRETGQQFNPVVIRAIARIGRAMGEHDFIGGGGARKQAPLEERFYPDMKG